MVKSTIQIFCRVKPPRRKQVLGQYDIEAAENGGENLQFLLPREAAGGYVNNTRESFKGRFQRIFDVDTKQEEVFDSVAKPVIENVLSGYNGSIFAYGQTGSGKTFTITGGPEKYADRGIIPRSISHIFREFDKQSQYLFTLHVSYLEIYNNHGYDLLDPRHEISKLEDLPKVTMMEDGDHNVHLKNLSVHLANTEEEALNLLFLGDTNRMIAETPMNQASTRSHCIFTVHVSAREHGSATIKKAKLHLVDLAGSERVAKTNVNGKLLDEAKYINASLHCLELVIISLSENKSHIPYRNSMMTNVLRDSLGGNCMTTMIATCSIEKDNVEESVSTVRFAQRVAMIKNEVTLNEELDPKLIIAKLKREADELKNQLHLASGGKQSDDPLEEYEIERCRAAVNVFLDESDPDAVVNVGADMRKINECFRILKAAVKKKNNNNNTAANNHAKENIPDNERRPYQKDSYEGGGSSEPSFASPKRSQDRSSNPTHSTNGPLVVGQSDARSAVSDEHVKKLQDLLLQRDNEIAILVNMLKREKEKGGGGGKNGRTAATTRDSRPSSAASTSDDKDGSSVVTGSRTILGDLSVGRQQAFEVFKRDYAENGKIVDQKEKLKANFRAAKELGEKVNASRETINRLKAQIEHYRVSLAMSMGMTSAPPDAPPDETETLIRDKLENEKRNYRFAFTQLKELKTEIEHQQHLLEKYRVKLQKDFEVWWTSQCEAAQRQKRLLNNAKEGDDDDDSPAPGVSRYDDSLGVKTSWMTPAAENGAVVGPPRANGHAGVIPSKGRTKSRTLTPVQTHPPMLETENTLMSVASSYSSDAAAPRTSQSTRSLPGAAAAAKPPRHQLEPLENRSAPPFGAAAEKARNAAGKATTANGISADLAEKTFHDGSAVDRDHSATENFTPAFSSPPPPPPPPPLSQTSHSVQSSLSDTLCNSNSSKPETQHFSSHAASTPKPTMMTAKPLPSSGTNPFDIPLTGDPKADADIMAFIKARAKIKAAARDKK